MPVENISYNQSPVKNVAWRGPNPRHPDHQSDAQPTEPLRPVLP